MHIKLSKPLQFNLYALSLLFTWIEMLYIIFRAISILGLWAAHIEGWGAPKVLYRFTIIWASNASYLRMIGPILWKQYFNIDPQCFSTFKLSPVTFRQVIWVHTLRHFRSFAILKLHLVMETSRCRTSGVIALISLEQRDQYAIWPLRVRSWPPIQISIK